MKKLFVLSFCMLFSGLTFAQDFEKGGNYVTAGFGFDPFYRPLGYYGIGPVVVGYERGITDILGIGRIGAGGTFGATFYPGTYANGVHYTGTRFSILGRATYHFEFDVPRMDVYAGVGLGVHIINEPYYNYYYAYGLRSRVVVGPRVFGGIRYYFTDVFGVYAEAGYGLSALNGGMVFAF